jgi:hypothetical protein
VELSVRSIAVKVNKVASFIAKTCDKDIDVEALTKVHKETKGSMTIVKVQKSYEDHSRIKARCLLLPYSICIYICIYIMLTNQM